MKNLKTFLAVAALAFCAQQASASVISSGTISVNGAIPDYDHTGFTSSTTINAPGVDISDVRIRLNITGFTGDLYAYLTHDNVTAILLNRIGTDGNNTFGFADPGMNVWIQDGYDNIHTFGDGNGSVLTGTFGADGRDADPWDLNAVKNASASKLLSGFYGHTADGEWTLFVADAGQGVTNMLVDWELEIVPVPEPTNVALGVFGGMAALFQGFRLWKARNLTQRREDAKE
jgi:subtilisin-like proprotein convertase family protein